MRAALALLIVLAACGGDAPGMRLEIRAGSTGATDVELYLATRPCTGCDGRLAPKGVTAKLAGKVWLLDGSAASGTPSTSAHLDGGRFVYDLRAPDATNDVAVAYIVVVGYDANKKVVAVGKLSDVEIHHDATEWFRLTLHPAVERTSSDSPDPAGDRVYVWRRSDPELAACVGLEQASSAGVERLWFVPEDDTDCDAMNQECDAYAYKANGVVDIANASCVTTKFTLPNTPMGTTCLIGGPACVDGQPADATCARVAPNFCVPDAVCAPTCVPNLPVCVRDTGTVPRITCSVPYNEVANGQPCSSLGGPPQADVDLGPLMIVPATQMAKTKCKKIRFAGIGLGRPNISDKLTSGPVELTTGELLDPCAFDLTWSSGPGTTLNGQAASFVALMDVELENTNHMVMPIAVSFHPSLCEVTDVMKCVVNIPATDGITHCAQQ